MGKCQYWLKQKIVSSFLGGLVLPTRMFYYYIWFQFQMRTVSSMYFDHTMCWTILWVSNCSLPPSSSWREAPLQENPASPGHRAASLGHRAAAGTWVNADYFLFSKSLWQNRLKWSQVVCVCVSVCLSIASHIPETSEAIAVKFYKLKASVMTMHHMSIFSCLHLDLRPHEQVQRNTVCFPGVLLSALT